MSKNSKLFLFIGFVNIKNIDFDCDSKVFEYTLYVKIEQANIMKSNVINVKLSHSY